MDFEGAPASGSLPLDDLFSGGGYTDYNLALQSDVPAGANSAPGAILHDVADSAGDILGAVTGNPHSTVGTGTPPSWDCQASLEISDCMGLAYENRRRRFDLPAPPAV